MVQVIQKTPLAFEAKDVSLYGNSKPINFGWTSGNDWVADTGKQQFGVVDFDFGPLGALEADATVSFQFGLRLNAGLGTVGALDTEYEILVNVGYDDFVVAGTEGTEVTFDFTDVSVVSAMSESVGIGATPADVEGLGEDDQPSIPIGLSLELVVGASFGFENIFYRLPFGSREQADNFSLFDFENQAITLFKVDAQSGEQSFDLSDEVSLVLRLPTGASTQGDSSGSTIVVDKGYSNNPFLALQGDLDALLTRLLKNIPGVNAVAAALENSVFLNEEIDLNQYVPFLPPEWFTFNVSVVDLLATAGLHVTEEVSVDIGYKTDENLPDFQLGGGTSIIDQIAGLFGEAEDPGAEKTPNIGVVLRSDNGTPDDPLDDRIARGSVGEEISIAQPAGTSDVPGVVTVDAWYDVENAKVAHSVGLGGKFSVTLSVLSASIGGSVGEKLGISFGPLFELEIPEDGLQVDLFNLFTRRFDVKGGEFSDLPSGPLTPGNDEFAEWGYTPGKFNQQTAQYQYYWTNVTPPSGLDESDPESRKKTIVFAETNAKWLEQIADIFQPLYDAHDIDSTIILNTALTDYVDPNRFGIDPDAKIDNTAVIWTASGAGESEVELAVGHDNVVIAAPTEDAALDGLSAEYSVTVPVGGGFASPTELLSAGLRNLDIVNFFNRTQQTLVESGGFSGRFNFFKVVYGERALDSELSPNVLGTSKNDLVIFGGEEGFKDGLVPVFNAPEYLDARDDFPVGNTLDDPFTGGNNDPITFGDVFLANFGASFPDSPVFWDIRAQELSKSAAAGALTNATYNGQSQTSVSVQTGDFIGSVLQFLDGDGNEAHRTIVRDFESYIIRFSDKADVVRTGGSGMDTLEFRGGNDTLIITSDTFRDRYLMGEGNDLVILDRVGFFTISDEDFAVQADYILGGGGHDEVLISSDVPAPYLTDSDLAGGLVWAVSENGFGPSAYYTTEDEIGTLFFGLSRINQILGSTVDASRQLDISDDTPGDYSPFANETYVQIALGGAGTHGARIASDVEVISVDGFDQSADLVFYTGGTAYTGGEMETGTDPVDVFVADFGAFEGAKTVDGVAPGGVNLQAGTGGIVFADAFVGEFERFIVKGTSVADVLAGAEHDDFLDGGTGDDVLSGGGSSGFDILVGGFGDDVIYFDGLGDTLVVGDAASYEDLDAGNVPLSGRLDNDLLVLRAPGTGTDIGLLYSVYSGDGNAELEVSATSSFDDVNMAATLRATANFFRAAFGETGEELNAVGIEATSVQGSDISDDLLIYDGGATYIGGERDDDADFFVADFSDQVEGLDFLVEDDPVGAGIVTLENGVTLGGVDRISIKFGKATDTVRGGRFDDYIDGGEGNDVITGDGGDDILKGNLGNDFFYWEGDDGRDIIDGGEGSDRLMISNMDDSGASLAAGGLAYDIQTVDPETGVRTYITPTPILFDTGHFDIEALLDVIDQADVWYVNIDGTDEQVEFVSIEAVDVQGSDAHDDAVIYQGGLLYAGGERGGDADLFAGSFSEEAADLTFRVVDARPGGQAKEAFYEIGNAAGTTIGEFERLHVHTGSGDDNVAGGILDDTFETGAGDDVITGSLGDDRASGGDGDDRFSYVGGNDLFDGGNDLDLIEISAQESGYSLQGIDLAGALVGPEIRADGTVPSGGFRAAFDEMLNSGRLNAVQLVHDYGSVTYTGFEHVFTTGSGAGDVLISGTMGGLLSADGGDDILLSNNGDDFLIGGDGVDTYVFGETFGHDIIANEFAGRSEVHFVGLDLADLTFGTDASGQNLVITLDADNSVTITGYFSRSANPQNFVFHTDDVPDGQTFDASGLSTSQANPQTVGAQFFGTTGDDEFSAGTDKAEFFFGFAGDDLFLGSLGADLLDGSLGNDFVSYETNDTAIHVDLRNETAATGGQAEGDIFVSIESVIATEMADEIFGNDQRNVILAAGGDDVVRGFDGDDFVSGGEGSDQIDPGAGDDMVFAGAGDDIIRADFDSDLGDDMLFGDAGDDIIVDLQGNNQVVGGQGNDTVTTGTGDDVYLFEGEADPDGINSARNGGQDTFVAGAGEDGVDFRNFGAGVFFSISQDQVFSGVVKTNDSDVYGDLGNERVLLQFQEVENVTGTEFSDLLWGSALANQIIGLAGNDTLVGFAGADTLDGGAGFDVVDYGEEAGSQGVSVVLPNELAQDSFGTNDTLINIEGVFGTQMADAFVGDDEDNLFVGNAGADFINGQGGIDTVDYSREGGSLGVVADLTRDVVTDTFGQEDLVFLVETYVLTDRSDQFLAGSVAVEVDARGGDDDITGSDVEDVFRPGTGTNTVSARGGNDVYYYQNGFDTFDGGGDYDILSLIESTLPVNVDVPAQLVYQFASANLLIDYSNVEQIVGSTLNDGLFGFFDDDILLGWSGNDLVQGRGGNDLLYGNSGDDEIDGGEGDDELHGGSGDDYAVGGSGNDVYFYTSGQDFFDGGADTDLISFEALEIGIGLDTFFGSAYALSSVLSNTPQFGATVMPGPDAVTLIEFGDIEQIIATEHDDIVINDISGGLLADVSLLAGDDKVFSFVAGSEYDGGDGTDTISYAFLALDPAELGVKVDLSTNRVEGGFAFDIVRNFENAIGTGGRDQFIGNSLDNTFIGGEGFDSFIGGAGSDTIDYSGETGSSGLEVNLFSSSVRDSHGNLEFASQIENVIGTSLGDVFAGSDARNRFEGGGGDDFIGGGGGNDTLIDGLGDDTVNGESGDDVLVHVGGTGEFDGGIGFDWIDLSQFESSVEIDLTAGVSSVISNGTANWQDAGERIESATLTGIENAAGSIFSDLLIGNEDNNALFGDTGDDTFVGNAGFDSFTGGDGIDFIDYSREGGTAGVIVAMSELRAVDSFQGIDEFSGIEGIIGTDRADILIGDDGDNIFAGNGGLDTISAGRGYDIIDYSLEARSSGVAVGLAGGVAIDFSGVIDILSGFEEVRGTDFADTLEGDDLDNTLVGNGGADTLSGLGGINTLTGGNGGDRFVVTSRGSTAIVTDFDTDEDSLDLTDFARADAAAAIAAAEEQDSGLTLRFADGSLVVLEGLVLADLPSLEILLPDEARPLLVAPAGGGLVSGTDRDEYLQGRDGADVLSGGPGDDFVSGGQGDDDLDGGQGFDVVTYQDAVGGGVTIDLGAGTASGADGNDLLASFAGAIGSQQSDEIRGSSNPEMLVGLGGSDLFIPGTGADEIETGAGSDEVRGTGSELDGDRIKDLEAGDKITLLGTTLDGSRVKVLPGSAIFELDADLDGVVDVRFTLDGDFEGAVFEVVTEGTDSTIRLAEAGSTQLSEAGERFFTTDPAANRVYGSGGDDTIVTSNGNDILSGGSGSDEMIGGNDSDVLVGGLGSDFLTGGLGPDTFVFNAADFGTGGFAADFITDFLPGEDRIELYGFDLGSADDLGFVSTPTGDAIALGNGGFVVLEGLTAGELLAGDIVLNEGSRTFSLVSTTTLHLLSEAADRFITEDDGNNIIEALGGDDILISSGGVDQILGGEGADTALAGGGDDIIVGGQGSDILGGGSGADTFVFIAGEEVGFAADFIADFEPGTDTVELRGYAPVPVDQFAYIETASGDIALQLEQSRFIVFEGYNTAEAILPAETFIFT